MVWILCRTCQSVWSLVISKDGGEQVVARSQKLIVSRLTNYTSSLTELYLQHLHLIIMSVQTSTERSLMWLVDNKDRCERQMVIQVQRWMMFDFLSVRHLVT